MNKFADMISNMGESFLATDAWKAVQRRMAKM
jgi:hypothetical protein